MSTVAGTDAAARMERMYRWQRHFYDLSRRYYLRGRDRLIAELDLAPDETLLELGCGTARNLIAIGERYPGARLFGLDAAEAMLEVGRAKIRAAGLDGRIALAFGLAGDGQERARFARTAGYDRILMSYALSMFDDPARAIDSAHAALAAHGRIHIVDFGLMQGLPRAVGSGFKAFLRHYQVVPSDVPRARLAELATTTGAALRVHDLDRGYARLMHYGPAPR